MDAQTYHTNHACTRTHANIHTRIHTCTFSNNIMLNKNSLGLLKRGAAKQSRIKSIEALVRARAQPVVKWIGKTKN